MGEYRLSAGAVLYAVFLLHKRSIYGVPAVMPPVHDRKFPAFAQEAEQELMDSGCGILDFDGIFTLDPDFSALLGRCADCREVFGANLYQSETERKLTIYRGADALLERDGKFDCVLRPAQSPKEELLRALSLPAASDGRLAEVRVDTGVLERRSLEGIMASGCGEAQARMILNALEGKGGYAHLVHTTEQGRVGELVLLYGPEGILQAGVEYTETQELMRLTPITPQEAVERLQTLSETGQEGVL